MTTRKLAEADHVRANENIGKLLSTACELGSYLQRASLQDIAPAGFTQEKLLDRERPLIHTHYACEIADILAGLSNELNKYAKAHAKILSPYFADRMEWPWTISVINSRDVSRSQNASNGTTAPFDHISKFLGRKLPIDYSKIKNYNVFHKLAIQFQAALVNHREWTRSYRELGLPWFLDYFYSQDKFFYLDAPETVAEIDTYNEGYLYEADNQQWVIALKYYIHLVLAPEPQRKIYRENWMAFRRAVFEIVRKNSQDRRLVEFNKTTLRCTKAFKISGEFGDLYSPEIYYERDSDQLPRWKEWWNENLLYPTECYFGKSKTLMSWEDDEITRINKQKHTSGGNAGYARFSRAVDLILDKALIHRKINGGINNVDLKRKEFPKIPSKLFTNQEIEKMAVLYADQFLKSGS
jgi:hypothetical protein